MRSRGVFDLALTILVAPFLILFALVGALLFSVSFDSLLRRAQAGDEQAKDLLATHFPGPNDG